MFWQKYDKCDRATNCRETPHTTLKKRYWNLYFTIENYKWSKMADKRFAPFPSLKSNKILFRNIRTFAEHFLSQTRWYLSLYWMWLHSSSSLPMDQIMNTDNVRLHLQPSSIFKENLSLSGWIEQGRVSWIKSSNITYDRCGVFMLISNTLFFTFFHNLNTSRSIQTGISLQKCLNHP